MSKYTDLYIATLIPNTTSAVINIQEEFWVLAHLREEEYPVKYVLTYVRSFFLKRYFRTWDEVVIHLKQFDNGE